MVEQLFLFLNMKTNKQKILVVLLLLTSLIGYTEWGKGQSMFLFQMEYEVFFGAKENFKSLSHPLIILPLLGQLALIYSLLTKHPFKRIIISGASAIFILLFIFFLVGLLTQNVKIIGSTLPFLVVYFYTLIFYKKNTN